MTDYYKILGITRESSPEDIKQAYRRLAAKHHPDRGGDTAKFQEIQAAYDILGNPEKKAQYDSPQPQMGGFHFHASGFPPGFEDIFSHFNDAFGGMFRPQGPQRNRTLNIQAQITLEEAFAGKDLFATIRLPSGREQMVEVKIPAGINDGTTLRLGGLGDDSIPTLPRGDLHLTVHVLPHGRFTRHGDDLVINLTINCIEAMTGVNKIINTIDNKNIEIKINPGTQHGQTLAVHGYGMCNVSNNLMRGRLLINIQVEILTNLTDRQKSLIDQFFN